jgi:hypothetical protein
MHGELKQENVEAARRDLENRTLPKVGGDFARLIYLASTRDYNTGEYHHDGLADQFTETVARRALACCHWEVFRRLALCSVKELVEELDIYVRSNCSSLPEFIRVWEKLQPYTVTVPLECSPLTARFFALNIRAALAVLHSRQPGPHPGPRSASPRH